MKKLLHGVMIWLTVALLTGTAVAAGVAPTVRLNPKKPQTLMIWHYYNGIQQQTFDRLVLEFNESVGTQQGVIVEAHSQGSINDLTAKLISAANKDPGAEEMPDLFGAYADTAYQLDQMGLVADLAPYLTQAERDAYVDSYIQEGELGAAGTLKVFPIAKSTELLLLNETDWEPFATATGMDKSLLATWEGIVKLSKAFYEWSDAQTPDDAGDGKAFFGRDAVANYMLIGSMQLGVEMFYVVDGKLNLQVDKAVVRKLWDHYYVPFVNGWFGAYGRFRSDDVKTGQLIALVGSTSGALYFPSEITRDDGTTYPIVSEVYPLPNFEGTKPYAVQQGAGLVVTKSTPEKEFAATLFLKWFTQAQHNIEFSIHSGYLPVLKAANNQALLDETIQSRAMNPLLKDIIDIGVSITTTYNLYTNSAFEHGYEARLVVENSIADAAKAALEQRDALIATGMSRDAAVAQLTDDATFETWFAGFKAALETAVR